MIKTIEHLGNLYPEFQASGFAARFAFPFAAELCKGFGVDVGCNRSEWKLPGAFPVDPEIDSNFHANKFPVFDFNVDYIFSSHCLEHVPDWVGVLDYWATQLKIGGVLFLYLPHPQQTYWRPWHNRKHVNVLHPEDVKNYLTDSKFWTKGMVTGHDLNHSYYAIAERV